MQAHLGHVLIGAILYQNVLVRWFHMMPTGSFKVALFSGTAFPSFVHRTSRELLRNPHIMEKAQAKMDSVVGRERLVEESDLPNFWNPYLNAIVRETFRLHPVGAILVPHLSTEDCENQGYKIPARTTLFVNTWAIQRDPNVYERPLDFYPERFLGHRKDVHGQETSDR
ncbi:hypothetical protein R1sor_020046 [Riccia sorocarpa]|uniref:Cytochrome P450 n=1 Tax=Riccia sorocarpa TaxID=122646 RepID=A0ABD3IFW9_9MARC